MSSKEAVRETRIAIGPALGRLLDAARGAGLPVLLSGRHGIGKSEYLENWAHERGLEPFVLDLSLLEATDLTGLPEIRDGRTRYAPPGLLPSTAKPSVLVLEELNRCDRSVRQPCLQLLTARRLNDYRLPDHCFIVACVNPGDLGYDVDELDPALASRFLMAHVEPDRLQWIAWAREAGLNRHVVSFVERHSQALAEVPPRTWTYVSRLVQAAVDRGHSLDDVSTMLGTLLPRLPAKALAMELGREWGGVPTIDELLREPEKHARRWVALVDAGRLDQVQSEVAGVVEWITNEPAKARAAAEALKTLAVGAPPDLRARLKPKRGSA